LRNTHRDTLTVRGLKYFTVNRNIIKDIYIGTVQKAIEYESWTPYVGGKVVSSEFTVER
jgi:hypothetical protein